MGIGIRWKEDVEHIARVERDASTGRLTRTISAGNRAGQGRAAEAGGSVRNDGPLSERERPASSSCRFLEAVESGDVAARGHDLGDHVLITIQGRQTDESACLLVRAARAERDLRAPVGTSGTGSTRCSRRAGRTCRTSRARRTCPSRAG